MRKQVALWPILLIALVGLCFAAGGAESSRGDSQQQAAPPGPGKEPTDNPSEKPLRIVLSLYGWLSSLSSTVEVRDREISSDVRFRDLLSAVDFGGFAHLEVQRGKWGGFSDVEFIKLSGDSEFRRLRSPYPFKIKADGVMKETVVELGAIRSFEGSRIGVDALAGARYFRLASDAHIGPMEQSTTKAWVDPLLGARLRFRLSDKWQASLRGDLAGFGVGSELTINVVAIVGYTISERYSVGFGYRYLDLDYEENRAEMNTATYGPVVGFAIRF